MPYRPQCGHRWIDTGEHLVCDWCGAIGYRKNAAPGSRLVNERIYVYVCGVEGCKRTAVYVDTTKTRPKCRCKVHKP